MRCVSCGLESGEIDDLREGGETKRQLKTRGTKKEHPRECVSCGKEMDMGVYFTMCPHCGFNYRIEITPIKPKSGGTSLDRAGLYVASISVPVAGFLIGAMLWNMDDALSRRLANGCVALGALNIVVTPILLLRLLGWA